MSIVTSKFFRDFFLYLKMSVPKGIPALAVIAGEHLAEVQLLQERV